MKMKFAAILMLAVLFAVPEVFARPHGGGHYHHGWHRCGGYYYRGGYYYGGYRYGGVRLAADIVGLVDASLGLAANIVCAPLNVLSPRTVYYSAPAVQVYNPAPAVQVYNPAPAVQVYNPAPAVQVYGPAGVVTSTELPITVKPYVPQTVRVVPAAARPVVYLPPAW